MPQIVRIFLTDSKLIADFVPDSLDLSTLSYIPATSPTLFADQAVAKQADDDSLHSGLPTSSDIFTTGRLNANKARNESPIWAITPTYCSPTNGMDALVIDLLVKQRENNNATEFSKVDFPSVSSLLNPVLHEPDQPVASTIARHVASVIRVHTVPEKIALLYAICISLRWNICPTPENYDAIPEFLRPTGTELIVQHPVWVGTIGWPKARERIIRHMDFTQYPEFARLITSSFSINWRHGLVGILKQSPDQGYTLTEDFVQHVRCGENWTVGISLVEAFPFLQGAVNIKP